MKKVLIGIGAVVAVLIVALVAIPFLIDVNSFKPQIEAKAKEVLNREVTLGQLKLSIFPSAVLEVSDVRVANVPGGVAKEMASIKGAVVSVNLMPLLSRKIEVTKFALIEPTVNLEVDKQGKPNWAFGDGKPAPKPADSPGAASGELRVDDIRIEKAKISFVNLQNGSKIALDPFTATGNVALAAGARPAVRAKLEVDRLAMTPQPGQQPPAQQGWSNDPIDVTALRTFDADLALSVGQIQVNKIRTGKATLKVTVKDGKATIDAGIPKPGLYDGEAALLVGVNVQGPQPVIDIKAKLAEVSAEPYLKDASDLDRLTGKLSADLAATGRGMTQRQIVAALNGNGAFKFADGAIKGIDLGAVAKQMSEMGKGGGGAAFDPTKLMTGVKNLFGGVGSSEKTDFSAMTASFTIANGVISNKDLLINSQAARVTGEGTVSLPPRTMDYRIKIVSLAGGESAPLPVICKGPWAGESCGPELGASFLGNIGSTLKGLLPGGGGTPAPTGTATTPPATTTPPPSGGGIPLPGGGRIPLPGGIKSPF